MNESFPVPQKSQDDFLASFHSQRTALLLSEIWQHGPISRSHLGKILGLAQPSVTRFVQELKNDGLILESEKGKSSGGRQPLLLQINPDAGLVIGLDLSGVELRGGIFDATNQCLKVVKQPFSGKQFEAIKEQIIQMSAILLADPITQNRLVRGFGVSVPGTVDQRQGIVRDALNMELHFFPIRDILQENFGLPVFLEHDTSAAARAEMYFGVGRGVKDLIYITVSTGIGAGLVINHQIHRGVSNLAGELGHVVVERDGQICNCGKRGCLEAVAAVPAMLSNWQHVLYRQSDMRLGGVEAINLEALAKAASAGEYVAKEIISRSADYLAMTLSMMASIIDIRLMIIGGEVIELGDLYFTPLRAALQKYQPEGPEIQVVPAQLGENACLSGVAMLALEKLLVR